MTSLQSSSRPPAEGSVASAIEEIDLVPRWSIGLAAAAFLGMQYFWLVVIPSHRHRPSTVPLGIHLYFAFSWSALAALYVLMVGYVTRDAPRRGMSARIWTVICVVMPGGIGSVLYFLLRQPVVSLCPSCGVRTHRNFHFCPQCAYQVAAACRNCYRDVRPTDLYCVWCGHDLSADNTPMRLRAFP